MQTIKQLITAAAGYNANLKGLVLFVQDCDQGDALTITLTDILGNRYTVQEVGPGAKIKPAGGFTNVQISTPEDANVMFIVTSGDIEIQNSSTESVITNGDAQAVPVRTPAGTRLAVDIGGGTIDLTATNVTINNTSADPVPVSLVSEPGAPVAVTKAPSATVATVAPVAVAANNTGAVLLAVDAARRGVRFYAPQSNAGPVAIVPDNATAYASAAIVLYPGDFWNEDEAPGAAWYASTPGGTGGTINMQTVKA
jgi:hypothetical protein